MSFSKAETGLKVYHSRFNKGYRYQADCNYAELIPFCMRFVLPGDVWRIGADALIRYQPMLSPPLSRANARFRWFFVPLRQVEPNCEKVITGSDDGKVISGALPTFKHVGDDISISIQNIYVRSLLDYMGMPIYQNYSNNTKINYASPNVKGKKCLMARYWVRGYFRIWNDYYRDENLNSEIDITDATIPLIEFTAGPSHVNLKRDYFTSSLKFQLKGVAPSFQISLTNPFQNNLVLKFGTAGMQTTYPNSNVDGVKDSGTGDWNILPNPNGIGTNTYVGLGIYKDDLNSSFNGATGSFDGSDLRTMMSQTRLFERLARCGSRYVEYLRANFNTAPADDTLQRPRYLGGFKQPIVTTEIVQTAEDGTNPVGTLRGKGISAGGNNIGVHRFNEFGLLYGLVDIEPETLYTQGIDREFTYTERFDFFNPSFQHLSEQEIRNGELYITDADTKNDETFGFTEYANELRYSQNKVVGNLRGNLSYWTQPINFNSRPNLNSNFLNGDTYKSTSWAQPFVVKSNANPPIILDIQNLLDVYRPMVRHSTPGGL